MNAFRNEAPDLTKMNTKLQENNVLLLKMKDLVEQRGTKVLELENVGHGGFLAGPVSDPDN